MKKIQKNKLVPVIGLGILLLISAVTFPVLAERFQVKGMENGAKNLEIDPLKILDLVVEENQGETKAHNTITMIEEEEKCFDEIVSLLQKSTLLVSPKNRELSATESNRLIELRKEFREGSIKSTTRLPIGENLRKPYFNPNNETYYYPESEMTDKELLQIIDFDEKLNLSFARFNQEYIQKVMDSSNIKISEEEAIKSAKGAIERIYNVELDNMEIKSSFNIDEHNNENSWRIIFEPKSLDILKDQEKLYWMYFSDIDIYSGKVNYVDSYYSGQRDEIEESPETDLNDIEDHKRLAEEVLANNLNAENIKFHKAYVRKPNTLLSFNKSLYLVYKAEDKYIEFEMLYGSKRIVGLFFHDDPVKLNERVNRVEQESIGNIM